MSRLTGFLPVTHDVAAYAALTRETDRLQAGGDTRSRGQIMADLMVARLTGQEQGTQTPVEVVLLIRDTNAQVFLRRVFTHPGNGSLVSMQSRARLFPPSPTPAAHHPRPGVPHPLV